MPSSRSFSIEILVMLVCCIFYAELFINFFRALMWQTDTTVLNLVISPSDEDTQIHLNVMTTL